ncbi:MAG: hypothetical protein LBP28_03185 [Coriobacteriales bacterium]|jgi:hypothetical protein|nr:hypothetical protein [Coriobacteriales bacterium]
MRRRYLITDDTGTDYGTLTYQPDSKAWQLEINPARTWDDTPLSLAIYIRQGRYSLDARQSLAWVRDRLLPPNRQNINQILRELKIPEYDEAALIEKTGGVSANDYLYLVEQP